ncbi:uncharacterized protein LOC122296414 isoform X1 [Carya illinoinensis]|uniref:uncharacterized protein LOC122296414 isoform X1 n=1 Tax=Carya illinoinensis TaxID=32201 RepID=UPI001C725792|nr:uncharacterized protein LOC122296414 isoform X1 [Carya illinoinensis]
MVRSLIGRGVRGRGGGFRGISVRRPIIQDAQSPPRSSEPNLRDEVNSSSSDDSTQPPDVVFETEFPEQLDGTAVSKKRGRGRAKMTKFDMLRKMGPIPLLIKNGDTKVSCQNANIFSGRVTWIIKHYANMGYNRWNEVPEAEQEELCGRVRADFIVEWEKENHRKTVIDQLRRRFNSFHYDLHKIFLGYGSTKVALARGTELVDHAVWRKLCMRWGSKEFKALSLQNKANRGKQLTNHTAGRKSFVRILEEQREGVNNLVEFFKETRWSKKKNGFVTDMSEELYEKMVEKLNEMQPEERTKEAAAAVFREVLGRRSGYERGLGEKVMPITHGIAQTSNNGGLLSEDAQYWKAQFEGLKANVQEILLKQAEFDKFMTYTQSQQQSQGEFPRKTPGAM